jgi:NTE family protein
MNVEMSAVCTGFANKMKIGIPEALSKGMYNYNLLSRITRNSRHIKDFNKLPSVFYVSEQI